MGKAAALILACCLWMGATPAPVTLPTEVSSATSVDESRPLLHTIVHIKAHGPGARAGVDAAFEEMERMNRLLNNYDPASEVSALNRQAGGGPVPVSPETLQALQRAVHFGALSGGAFDITVGPLLELWGFDHDNPGLSGPDPEHGLIGKVRALVDYRAIELAPGSEGAAPAARLSRPGMRIDVGAFSKGFVADRAMETLQRHGITCALIAAGGTIVAAGTRPDGTPWQIGIRHPRRDDTFLTRVSLSNASVSTSGDYERFYTRGGKRRAHIIDPRSGRPVEGKQAVTVIAPTGDTGDALSTALFVLDLQEGLALVERLEGVEALLVAADGRIVVSSGWPPNASVR